MSHDPNNTAWSRSATKYGQKILQSHGWTPGELLGASDTPYSDLRSAASASHVRISIKDDNLGLGAKHEAAHASSESTGLDVFQDLLGRLNGKTATNVEKDRLHRSNLRCSAYIDQRWGHLRFVSGGFLIGAESKGLVKDVTEDVTETANHSHQTPNHCSENETQPEAKRPQDVRPESSKRQKHKKRKILGGMSKPSKEVEWSVVRIQSSETHLAVPERESYTLPQDILNEIKTDKARRHAEKAERKLKRQIKRDARDSLELQEHSLNLPRPGLSPLLDPNSAGLALVSHPLRETKTSTEVTQGPGAGRLAVRHRYIHHKKMCMMDNKALNEVRNACSLWWDSEGLTTRRY